MNRFIVLSVIVMLSLNSAQVPAADSPAAAPKLIPNVDRKRIADLAANIRACALSDGLINLVPFKANGDPVEIQPYFAAFGLLGLSAEVRIDQDTAAINLPIIRAWLVSGGDLMAPQKPFPRRPGLVLPVDLEHPISRDGTGVASPDGDTQNYFVLNHIVGRYQAATNTLDGQGRTAVGVDAADSTAAMYLLVAGLYAQQAKTAEPTIDRGVEASVATLKACYDKGKPYRSFTSKTNGLRQCMDNFEVYFGLMGAKWYFESRGNKVSAADAAALAAELADDIKVFYVTTTKGEKCFTPLPDDPSPMGVQPAHGYTNLAAITAVLDKQADRDSLYRLVKQKIPMEYGKPLDAQRKAAENTYLPWWCLAVNRTSLQAEKTSIRKLTRQRADYLVYQAVQMRAGNRFTDRRTFQAHEYGLTILALLSEYQPPPELPAIAFVPQ